MKNYAWNERDIFYALANHPTDAECAILGSSPATQISSFRPNKSLSKICNQAKKNWKLIDILVIHRFGSLNVNQKIVLVATFAIHRHDSIAACNYIMDYLKKDAPFWKKEYYDNDSKWLQNTTKTI